MTKALILAAGQGTRLRPLTEKCPKPMVPIQGQPLLAHTVAWLHRHGIDEIAINLNHFPQVITDYFGNGSAFGVQLTYSYENPVLGTAGAVRQLSHFFQDESFVVVYGDVLTDLNLAALLQAHHQHQERDAATGITLSLMSVENPTEVGLVEQGEDGRIIRFVEKPKATEVFTDLANAGVSVVAPHVLDYIPPDTFYDFGHDLYPALFQADIHLYGWQIPRAAYCRDIGTLEMYHLAQIDWPRHCQARQATTPG